MCCIVASIGCLISLYIIVQQQRTIKRSLNLMERMQKVHQEERKEWSECTKSQEEIVRKCLISADQAREEYGYK